MKGTGLRENPNYTDNVKRFADMDNLFLEEK